MDRKIERKGLSKQQLITIIATTFIGALIYYVFGVKHISTFKISKDQLSISTVNSGNFDDYIRLTSYVEPISITYLDAVEGGRVEEKLIEEGEMVKKGDIILRLSNPDLNLSILNSQANLAEQENFLRNTVVTIEQQRISNKQQLIDTEYDVIRKKRGADQNIELFKDGLVSKEIQLRSQEDYEIAQKQYQLKLEQYKQDSLYRRIQIERMDQNLKNMQQNLELVHQRVENLNVKATIDGQLGLLNAEHGQSIGRGARIGQINNLSNFKITAQVDEHYIERVKHGQVATLERGSESYSLVVKKVYPEVREGRFKIDMIFEDKRPENIRTGQTYYTKLKLGMSDKAITVPKGGFFQSTGGEWVYMLDISKSYATKRYIKIGRQNPNYYEVIEGLKGGEQIITSSYDSFKNYDKIEFK